MPQLDNPIALPSLDRPQAKIDHLFTTTFAGGTNAEFNQARLLTDKPVTGLPNLQIFGLDREKSPWQQPAESRDGWERFLKFVGHGDTCGDRVKEQVLKGLTKEQEKAYNHEEAARRNYEMSATIGNFAPPPSPMHDLVNQRVRAAEKEIKDTVRAHMSPAARQELDKELKDMDEQFNKWRKHAPTLDDPHISAGPAVKKFFEAVAHATKH